MLVPVPRNSRSSESFESCDRAGLVSQHNDKMSRHTMRTRKLQKSGSQVSLHGRVSRKSKPFEIETELFSNRPSVVENRKRRRLAEYRRRAKSRVAVDCEPNTAACPIVPEPQALCSSQDEQSEAISAMSRSELKGMLKSANMARKELIKRGFIAEWSACKMKTAVWVNKVELIPAKMFHVEAGLGMKLPSVHREVAHAKIKFLLWYRLELLGREFVKDPRLKEITELSFSSPLLLHCLNSALSDDFKPGSKVFMSAGKTKRKLIAYISSVESVSYEIEPYRSYGDGWEAYMDNSNLPIPVLVFE